MQSDLPQDGREGLPDLPRVARDGLPDGQRFRLAVAARDEAALARFYAAYAPRIHAFVKKHVQDEHTAEDLTEDVFHHVVRALGNYDPSRELRPWVFAVAANVLRDHWRSRKRHASARVVSIDDELAERLPGNEERPSARIERGELSNFVRDAVAKLPESLRSAVWLRAFEGLSFEEIAARLGRNVEAVRKRYSRGLAELRAELA